jgi:hypothetical protein
MVVCFFHATVDVHEAGLILACHRVIDGVGRFEVHASRIPLYRLLISALGNHIAIMAEFVYRTRA